MLQWRVRTSGAFVAAAFIPSETNAVVASVTNVTSIRTRRRLRRRISRYIADSRRCSATKDDDEQYCFSVAL